MKYEFERDFKRNVDVITNGYDTDDVAEVNGQRSSVIGQRLAGDGGSFEDKFIIAHVGTLVRSRNSSALWNSIAALMKGNPDFAKQLQIRLTGKVDIAVRNSLRDLGLENNVTYIDYLPHDQVIREQQQASVLLLVLNDTPNAKGILTGKMFEYLAARRPILCIGPPDGDAAAIIDETNSGQTINFDDQQAMDKAIAMLYAKFKSGSLNVSSGNVEKYSRRELTGEMVKVFEGAINEKNIG